MNKVSFFYAITITLLVPVAHAMEKENPINPNVFTQQGKEYMDYSVDLWVDAAKLSGSTTGLAAIFKNLKETGIKHLINDPVVLTNANIGVDAMLKDPVFQTLRDLQKIATYTYNGAPQLRADISRVVTQAVAMNVLVHVSPKFKTPPTNLINFFVSEGQASISDNIELLKLNEQLDVTADTPHIAALVLIMGYLAQTGTGR